MKVSRYLPEQAGAWDELVAGSRNGCFMHRRGYLDYHADRFSDWSLMVHNEQEQLVACLPANRSGDTLVSHGGITYAGLIMSPRLGQSGCLAAFEAMLDFLRAHGLRQLSYKATPHVFHRLPAADDLYALFRCGARLVRRDASTVISLADPAEMTKGRKSSIGKARRLGVCVEPSTDIAGFHSLLRDALARHGATPVHSEAELALLMSRFPGNIRIYTAFHEGRPVATTLLFLDNHFVHTQYMASSEAGRAVCALDLLIGEMILQHGDRRHFSFGISTEEAGQVLNSGLIAQKEGFGGHTVVHDFYLLDL